MKFASEKLVKASLARMKTSEVPATLVDVVGSILFFWHKQEAVSARSFERTFFVSSFFGFRANPQLLRSSRNFSSYPMFAAILM